MHEKNYDPFFDDNTQEKKSEQNLLDMIRQHDRTAIVSVRKGSRVKGAVVRIGADYVFIDIGAKNEAAVKIEELTDPAGVLKVAVGNTVEGYVVSDSGGEIMVSTAMSGNAEAPTSELYTAMREKIPVQGKVTGVNKGGLQVKVLGHRGFCPMSQIEIRYVEDVNVYLNRTMDFAITNITEGGRNILLSRVPLLEDDLEKELDALSAGIATGAMHTGGITRIAPFGLFVRIGSLDGLVHISEAAWDRVDKLDELFTVGQRVSVKILGVEKREPLRDSKISLSIRQVDRDPWTDIEKKFPVGTQLPGTVTRLADFGAFVRIAAGVEGLVHVSEMAWGTRVKHPRDVVSVGKAVNVIVLAVNPGKKTISLSLKDPGGDPWLDIGSRLQIGSIQAGTVASRQSYGFFVDLSAGVTGLLALPNIAADKKNEIKTGQSIAVKIEKIDAEQQRISLSFGMEQAAADDQAFAEFQSEQKARQKAAAPESAFAAALKAAMEKKKR
jgi:small subunit ribosomal protein S1